MNINSNANTSTPSIQLTLPIPPLCTAQPHPNALVVQPPQRIKKKSKYTKEQDDLILSLKKQGRSWVEIAEQVKCGNFLAARNRYQVLIGQQGGGAVAWSYEDTIRLQSLLDKGEKEKWKFIATELTKVTSKRFTDVQCRDMIKELFSKNPSSFGVVVSVGAGTSQQQQHQQIQIQQQQAYQSMAQSKNQQVPISSQYAQDQQKPLPLTQYATPLRPNANSTAPLQNYSTGRPDDFQDFQRSATSTTQAPFSSKETFHSSPNTLLNGTNIASAPNRNNHQQLSPMLPPAGPVSVNAGAAQLQSRGQLRQTPLQQNKQQTQGRSQQQIRTNFQFGRGSNYGGLDNSLSNEEK